MSFVQPPFWARGGGPVGAQHVGLSLVTAPASEPLSIADVKRQLNLDDVSGEPAPTVPTVTLVASAGNVTSGVHRWLWVFRTADGHTEAGGISAALTTITASAGQVTVTKPTGGSQVTYCDLYRSAAGGSTYLLVAATANDGIAYTDNIADAALGAQAPTTNTTLDPQLLGWITAARMYVESRTQRALISQTWKLTLNNFPTDRRPIAIPIRPLQKTPTAPIVTYTDTGGATQTLDAATYDVDAPAGPYADYGRLLPVFDTYYWPYPPMIPVMNGVTVQFVAGYGAAADVPWPLKQAMLLLIGTWFVNRQSAVLERASADMLPHGVDALLADFEPVAVV